MVRILTPVISAGLVLLVVSFYDTSSPDQALERLATNKPLNRHSKFDQQSKIHISDTFFTGGDSASIAISKTGKYQKKNYLNLSKNLIGAYLTPKDQTLNYIKNSIVFTSESEHNSDDATSQIKESVYTTIMLDQELPVTQEEQSQMYLQHTFSPR